MKCKYCKETVNKCLVCKKKFKVGDKIYCYTNELFSFGEETICVEPHIHVCSEECWLSLDNSIIVTTVIGE